MKVLNRVPSMVSLRRQEDRDLEQFERFAEQPLTAAIASALVRDVRREHKVRRIRHLQRYLTD